MRHHQHGAIPVYFPVHFILCDAHYYQETTLQGYITYSDPVLVFFPHPSMCKYKLCLFKKYRI